MPETRPMQQIPLSTEYAIREAVTLLRFPRSNFQSKQVERVRQLLAMVLADLPERTPKEPHAYHKIPHYHCLRCDHSWPPRKAQLPTWCPKCKSPYWDKPKRLTATLDTPASGQKISKS